MSAIGDRESTPPVPRHAPGHRRHEGLRPIHRREKKLIALLGVPTFGLALAIGVVSTYLPLVARDFTKSTTVIGLIVGGEGMTALFIPLLVGAWSDRLVTRIGGRLPFVLVGAPLVAASLAIMGLLGSMLAVVLAVGVFFIAYFIAYEPYRALYPDLIADDIEGTAQSIQALWRAAATGIALVGGGLLFSVAVPLPFLVAALLMLASIGAFVYILVHRVGIDPQERPGDTETARETARRLAKLIRGHAPLRAFLVANALWELSLGALKTFIVLFLTVGLGHSVSGASLLIGIVALIIVIASPVSGWLSDRAGRVKVMRIALWCYGLGLLVPLITQSPAILIPVIPFIAFGGAVLMSLPYALLIPMMPTSEHGALTGFYSVSRGIGTTLGPILAGAAVATFRGPLSSTHGYAAMFAVAGGAVLLSIPFMRALYQYTGPDGNLRDAVANREP